MWHAIDPPAARDARAIHSQVPQTVRGLASVRSISELYAAAGSERVRSMRRAADISVMMRSDLNRVSLPSRCGALFVCHRQALAALNEYHSAVSETSVTIRNKPAYLMGILRKYKQGQRAPVGNGMNGGVTTTPSTMGRMGVRIRLLRESEALPAALESQNVLRWVAKARDVRALASSGLAFERFNKLS